MQAAAETKFRKVPDLELTYFCILLRTTKKWQKENGNKKEPSEYPFCKYSVLKRSETQKNLAARYYALGFSIDPKPLEVLFVIQNDISFFSPKKICRKLRLE